MDFNEICLPLQRELADLEVCISKSLDSKVPFVQSVVEYVIQKSGKRLRPILTILSAKLSGYQGPGSISVGASIELMHTASLLHDDVIDNAALRRGRATPNKKWGNLVSVLVGDFFYCRAMDLLVRHGDLKVLRAVTDAVTTTTEGQILEISKSNDLATTQDDYLEVIRGKTATLIAACTQSGAILGQVSEDFEVALRRFGMNLGMAFQLMDDVLDYTSTEEEFGKVNGTDLKEGKLTLPVILALQRASVTDAQLIKDTLLSDQVERERLKSVLSIIERADGIRDTIKLAKSYIQKAKESLSPFKPSLEKEILLTIADYVLIRRN